MHPFVAMRRTAPLLEKRPALTSGIRDRTVAGIVRREAETEIGKPQSGLYG